MSRTYRNIGILLVSTCGVLTTYATLRPALEEQRAERLGQTLPSTHKDTAISDQMRDDFREAGQELENRGGFAWGIRKALFGRNPYAVVRKDGVDRESEGGEKG